MGYQFNFQLKYFLKLLFVSGFIIFILAGIQHRYILGLELSARFFLVPFVASFLVSFLGERIRRAQKKLDYEIFQAKAMGEQKLSNLGLFTAGVAHDFKNILQGFSFCLERMASDEKATRDKGLEEGRRVFKSGKELTENLLMALQDHQVELLPMNFRDVIEEGFLVVKNLIPNEVLVIYENDLNEQKVSCQTSFITQILLNLCVNSVKAISGGNFPRIVIKAYEVDGEFVVLELSDNGKGIPKQAINKIFDPFEKDIGSSGHGLGLLVVKEVVDKMKAKIEVESAINVGTTIKITFSKV